MLWFLKAIIGLIGTTLVLGVAAFLFLVGSMAMSGDDLSSLSSRIIYVALMVITLIVAIGGIILVWLGVLRLWP